MQLAVRYVFGIGDFANNTCGRFRDAWRSGITTFGILSVNKLGIIATTAGARFINLILPAVAGSLFITGIKLFRNR